MLHKFNDFISAKKLELIAKQTGFQKRTPRKITAQNFILSFINVYSSRNFSLRNWAQELSLISKQMVSFQALHKKLTSRHLSFLKEVFSMVISKSLDVETLLSSSSSMNFNRVLIEDSTCIKLSNSMLPYFSGVSNGKIKKPIARLQLCLDVKNKKIENIDITAYSKNDTAYSCQIIERINSKDLVIRDLGYWKTQVLYGIHCKGAYFISRLRNRTTIRDLKGNKYDLVTKLKELDKRNNKIISIQACLNVDGHMPVKIHARKVSCSEHQHRIKQSIKSRHKNCKIHPVTKYLLSWEIYVTNLINDEISSDEIKKLYKLRWQIEMYFKNWKSNYHIDKLLKSSTGKDPIKPEVLMYLSMIYMASIYQPNYLRYKKIIVKKYNKILSPLKFAEFLKSIIKTSMTIDQLTKQVLRYCCYDCRKDRINMEMQFQSLGLG